MKTIVLTNKQFRVLKRIVNTVEQVLDVLGLDEWTSDETMEGNEEVFDEIVKIVNREGK